MNKLKADWQKLLGEVKNNPLLSWLVLAICLALASISIFPAYRGKTLNAANAGEFGDFIGGFFGPIFSLVGIFLVVLTLREQRATTKAERDGEAVEAFQNKYYQLLAMHRQNVAEMQVGRGEKTRHGRKVFVAILDELQIALKIVAEVASKIATPLSGLEQLQIAYYVIFYGTGDKSSIQLKEAIAAADINFSASDFEVLEFELSTCFVQTPYTYFSGHQSRLGHYYRHLYQTIAFVASQNLDVDKREYTKTVRAQLSTHEQALLLVNSLTSIGWKWWSEGFLIEYKLVKNIPKGFLEEYCLFDPTQLFTDKQYFEWQEERVRPSELDRFTLLNTLV